MVRTHQSTEHHSPIGNHHRERKRKTSPSSPAGDEDGHERLRVGPFDHDGDLLLHHGTAEPIHKVDESE